MADAANQDAARAARIAGVLAAAESEILEGLPNERGRISDAQVNRDYYEGRGENYLEQRPAEDPRDFAARPKRCSLITKRVVDVLAEGLYNPGPARRFDQPAAVREWLALAYADANAAMSEADHAATLNDVALIQAAPTGDPAVPIRLHIWDSSQFAVWPDPEDCNRPLAIATIDRHDEQTRFTLWADTEVRVFATEKLAPGQTSGGRVARQVDAYENPYGCLPFIACPHRHQCGSFWVDGPGTPVRKTNAVLDQAMSDLGQAVRTHLLPVGIAQNTPEDFAPTIRPGGFINVPAADQNIIGEREPGGKLSYLQATIQIEAAWADINHVIDHQLETCGVPKSAVRMNQTGTASGVALVAEQLPLITRTRQRQPLAARWEQDLARVVLRVGGAWYDRPDLVEAAKAPVLTLVWPPLNPPMLGSDQDDADKAELEMGLSSKVDVLMRRRGIGREEAVETLIRVADDNRLVGSFVVPDPIPNAPKGTD